MKQLIFGNSGSGKSSLARHLARAENLEHLDLDSLAWLPTDPPVRMPLDASATKIRDFVAANEGWVIEGCYTDLLEVAAPYADEIVFLNLDVAQCVANAKRRPWEPHKYAGKEEQDKNLPMLIEWIQAYHQREDVFSQQAHLAFYHNFNGKKTIYTHNQPIPPG